MPLVLAIEPDRRQAGHLTAIVRNQVGAELVIADRGVEPAAAEPARELDRRDATAARRDPRDRLRMDDRAGLGNVLEPQELDPLDVTDNGDSHAGRISRIMTILFGYRHE